MSERTSIAFANTRKIELVGGMRTGPKGFDWRFKSFGQDGDLGHYFIEGSIEWRQERSLEGFAYSPHEVRISKAYFVRYDKKETMPSQGGNKVVGRANEKYRVVSIARDSFGRIKQESKEILHEITEDLLKESRYEQAIKRVSPGSKLPTNTVWWDREMSYPEIAGDKKTPKEKNSRELRALKVLHRRPDRVPFNLSVIRILPASRFENDFGISLENLAGGATLIARRLLAGSVAKRFTPTQYEVTAKDWGLLNDKLTLKIALIKGTRALFTDVHNLQVQSRKDYDEEIPEGEYYASQVEIDLPQGTKFKVLGMKNNEIFLKTIP